MGMYIILKYIQLLVHAGYDVSVAEKALTATTNSGIQPAIDW